MKPHRLWLIVTCMALFYTTGVLAQEKTEKLGRVHFPVSCGADTQAKFDRAVALLHSFWYAEGVKAFTAVTEADPHCAMGYWGIAMSHWYPLWRPPSEAALKQGWEAVQRAQAVGAPTEREWQYIAAIEIFYKDAQDLDHHTRALAYEKAMQRLSERYPEDREAAVFYALALNATIQATDKTYANQLKAADILEKVFAEQSDHPGVAHYLIHSYDYPTLASRGLHAARSYAKIAPSSPHALHMPSHVFTRLGLWQESIASNRDSAAASKEFDSVFEQLHALDYLAYGYLQLAQDRQAERVLAERNALSARDLEHFASAYAYAAIPARYALERRQWAEAAALEPRVSRVTYSEGITYFARALGAARSGDAASARANVDKLQALHAALSTAKQGYWAAQVEIQHREAAAWLALAEGRQDEAVRLMAEAATLEDATEKHPVTPGPLLPARELYGELLLELQQPAQALREFEASMPKEPHRFNGLYGAARAAEFAGETQKARAYYAQLVTLCAQSDTERPALQHAKAFLAKQ